MKKNYALLAIALTTVLSLAFSTNQPTVNARLANCHGSIHPTVGHNNGFGHPMCLPSNSGDSLQDDIQTEDIQTPVAILATPVVTLDVVTVIPTPVVEIVSEKVHCNNGDGNGAEGCNASDKGNQDETVVKGDKAENHPTH